MRNRIIPYNPKLKEYARKLRSEMTFSEVIFWKMVRNYQFMGYDFDRQKPILDYIVDFYCAELKLVVEIDGVTHEDEITAMKDHFRDERLKSYDLTILRFTGYNILYDMGNVQRTIVNYILQYEETFGVHRNVLQRRDL